MANTSVPVTPGSGANIAVNAVSGVDYQVVKVDIGADGASVPLVGDGSGNIPVKLNAIGSVTLSVVQATAANLKVDASGATVPVSDAGGSITVDAPVAAPVAVRLSSGSAFVDTIPVTGAVAATQSGAWAAAITDGTHNAHLTLVSATYALDVNVVSSTAIGGTALADGATFTAGTTPVTPLGAVYNDAIAAPSSGKAAGLRMNAARGLHVNPRDSTGAEIGTAASPLYVSPATSPNSQPVTGTVTANQGTAGAAAWKIDLEQLGGVAIAETAPLPVYQALTPHTRVSKTVTLTASQTGTTLWTPTSGKRFFIKKMVLLLSVGGIITFYDATNASGSILESGTYPIGRFETTFDEPFESTAINQVLKYDSGTGVAAVVTFHGWEE